VFLKLVMVLCWLSGYLQQYSELNIDFPQCGCAVWADIADAKREIIGDCMQRWWCWWGWDCGWDCSFGLAEAALAHGSRKLAVHSSADCSQVHFSCRIRRRWWGGSGVRGSGTGDRISDRSGSHWLGLSHAKNDKTVACPNPEPPEPEKSPSWGPESWQSRVPGPSAICMRSNFLGFCCGEAAAIILSPLLTFWTQFEPFTFRYQYASTRFPALTRISRNRATPIGIQQSSQAALLRRMFCIRPDIDWEIDLKIVFAALILIPISIPARGCRDADPGRDSHLWQALGWLIHSVNWPWVPFKSLKFSTFNSFDLKTFQLNWKPCEMNVCSVCDFSKWPFEECIHLPAAFIKLMLYIKSHSKWKTRNLKKKSNWQKQILRET